jgi:NADPH2:quinone reductase
VQALVATGNNSPPVELMQVGDVVAGPSEALVQVQSFAINRGELLKFNGAYGTPAERGWRPGQDIAGRVLASAADGSGPVIGDRVVGHPECGGWSERVAVPVSKLAVLPDQLDFIEAAALPLAGMTALRLLRQAGNLIGRRILITGASGGVGHFLVELAAGAGAIVTAVSSSPSRGERLLALGATALADSAASATGIFDLILESVGGSTFSAALTHLAPHGIVLWYGQASLKPISVSFFDHFASTPFTIKHFPYYVSQTTDAQDLSTLVSLVTTGHLHPEIGRVAHWTETNAVLAELDGRRIRGKAVLTVSKELYPVVV